MKKNNLDVILSILLITLIGTWLRGVISTDYHYVLGFTVGTICSIVNTVLSFKKNK